MWVRRSNISGNSEENKKQSTPIRKILRSVLLLSGGGDIFDFTRLSSCSYLRRCNRVYEVFRTQTFSQLGRPPKRFQSGLCVRTVLLVFKSQATPGVTKEALTLFSAPTPKIQERIYALVPSLTLFYEKNF